MRTLASLHKRMKQIVDEPIWSYTTATTKVYDVLLIDMTNNTKEEAIKFVKQEYEKAKRK